jgi:acetyltransferase
MTVIENLRPRAGERRVAAIGPAAGEIAGVESAGALTDLGWIPDAVVVAVGPARVVSVIREAGELGVLGAVIFAGGFAEAGASGSELQAEVKAIADTHGMAVIGPNCQGVVNFAGSLPLYSDVVHSYEAGRVALISQSGSVTTALINNSRGVRWSHAVSSGNEACIDAADLLEYFIHAPEVAIVCGFLETIRRPERFFALCALAYEAGKAVVVCKTGRTRAAQMAAAAHSGALSSPDRLVDALFRRHRVIRTESLSELLETAKAIGSGARPRGRRVAAVSGSGGHIGLLLDEADGTRLAFPAFEAATEMQLCPVLAAAGRVENPIDYWGVPNLDEALPHALSILAADENVDVLMAMADFSAGPTGRRPRAGRLLDAWEQSAGRGNRTLVLIDAVGGTPAPELIEQARDENVLVLSELGVGLKAVEHLIEYAAVDPPPAAMAPGAGLDRVAEILSEATPGINSGELPLRLIRAAGIPTVPTTVLASGDELDGHGAELKFPVVAKVADPSVAHRADRGGVILGINSIGELADAVARLRRIGDGSVMVQPQLAREIELLVGLHCSPELGTFVLIGIGGTFTEGIGDVAIAPSGLREGEAGALLHRLRGYGVLKATESMTASQPEIIEVVSRLDALGRFLDGRVQSLDINPLLVTPEGCVAVDALLVV